MLKTAGGPGKGPEKARERLRKCAERRLGLRGCLGDAFRRVVLSPVA